MSTERTSSDAVELEKPIPVGVSRRANILKELEATVCANRVQAYGDPENSFGGIAAFWNVYLGGRLSRPLTGRDVAVMQALLKCARLRTNINHADSWLDIAGYAICGGGLEDE